MVTTNFRWTSGHHGYLENAFNSYYDIVWSMTKARLTGLHEAVDTDEMFLRMFSELRRTRAVA